jgi:hypothetical protein
MRERQLFLSGPLDSGCGSEENFMRTETIETLLAEERRFPPPADFAAQANLRDLAIY